MRPSRLPLLLRGGVAAIVATFTALLLHVAAGGAMPGWLGIAVPLLLSTMVSVLLAGRRLSLARLTVAVTVSQFLFHTLFVLGAITPVRSMTAHQHGAPMTLPPAEGIVIPDAGMWVGHVLAAAATTAVLYRGEAAVRQLLRIARSVVGWVTGAVARPLTLPVGARPQAAPRVFPNDSILPIGLRVVGRMPRRGPPALSTL